MEDLSRGAGEAPVSKMSDNEKIRYSHIEV